MSQANRQKLMISSRVVPAGGYIPNEDAIDILVSDLALHAQKPNHPASLIRNGARRIKSGVMRRTYSSIRPVADGTFEMDINFDEQEVLDLLAKYRKRMLRIYMPTKRLPAYMAQDALEKIESLKRKHILQSYSD